jgi:prephenate dehydrogenase
MRIAVLGAGKMGIWFAKFFLQEGYSVVLADRNKEKLTKLKQELAVETADFVKAVEDADRILIAVSINAFEEVVKKIASSIRPGQLVMDICSIKAAPVKTMHEHMKQGLVLGMHPVFGPGSGGIKHKTFVLTPTNNDEEKIAKELQGWLEAREAHVFLMSPEKHDNLMSAVLGLPHFIGLVACDTLLEQHNYPETKRVAGTTYRMLFTLAEATALETPDLYASLQTSLPDLEKMENLFIEKAKEWQKLIREKDSTTIIKQMERVKAKLTKMDKDYVESYGVMYKMLESTDT